MKEIVDDKRICEVEGCSNLGEWNRSSNFKIYRRKLCGKHHRLKYGIKRNNKSPSSKIKAIKKFKNRGLASKCEICRWVGPCDVHRKVPMGPYNMENMMSSCPNCHRLIHRGLIATKPLTDPSKWKRNDQEKVKEGSG